MDLDFYHRKLIVGSHLGAVKVYDIASGIMTHQLEGHEGSEISYIGYGEDKDQTIMTCAWDSKIMIHMDEAVETKKPEENVLRGANNAHIGSILCGAYAHIPGLIATGGSDKRVRVWDYERAKCREEITEHKAEVSIVHFLKPLPLLLTSDVDGVVMIWITAPRPDAGKCVIRWRNNHNLTSKVPLTAIDSYIKPSKKTFLLFFADEVGGVRIQDFSKFYDKLPEIVPPVQDAKRNPHRQFAFKREGGNKKHDTGNNSDDENIDADRKNVQKPLLEEGDMK